MISARAARLQKIRATSGSQPSHPRQKIWLEIQSSPRDQNVAWSPLGSFVLVLPTCGRCLIANPHSLPDSRRAARTPYVSGVFMAGNARRRFSHSITPCNTDLMLSATVIVPTYNRPDALTRTLDALLAMEFPSELFDVVVIDTGKEELGAEAVARARGVRYERHPDLGVSAARNRGASAATGDILLFVDDDTVVTKENLHQHEAAHREDERCMVCGHRDFDPAVRHDLEATPLGRFRLKQEDRYNNPDGAGSTDQGGRVYPLMLAAYDLSIRREGFAFVGGFDE